MTEILLPDPNPERVKLLSELFALPRPPKELRAFELWGIDEELLLSPERLTTALGLVLIRMDLHLVGKPQIQRYHDKTTGAVGYSYNQFLEESTLTGHTYFEKQGHFDGVLATCDPNANLDPFAEVLFAEFKPGIGGYVYERPYPDLKHLDRLSRGKPPFEAITTTEVYRFWKIAPYGQINVNAAAEDMAA